MVIFLMMIFELLFIPLATILFLVLYSRQKGDMVFPVFSYIRGAVMFFAGIALFGIFQAFFPRTFSFVGLYFHYLGRDHLLHMVFAAAAMILIEMRPGKSKSGPDIHAAVAFFGGYYTFVSFFYFLENFSHLDYYVLFLLPVLHFATVLVLAVGITQFFEQSGIMRAMMAVFVIAAPLLFALPGVFALTNWHVPAILCTVLFAGAAGFLYYRLKDY